MIEFLADYGKPASGIVSKDGSKLLIYFDGGVTRCYALEMPIFLDDVVKQPTYNPSDYVTSELVQIGLIKLDDILKELEELRAYKKSVECGQARTQEICRQTLTNQTGYNKVPRPIIDNSTTEKVFNTGFGINTDDENSF